MKAFISLCLTVSLAAWTSAAGGSAPLPPRSSRPQASAGAAFMPPRPQAGRSPCRRPDVLELAAAPLAQPPDGWSRMQAAQLETLAEILEFYPEDQLFFVARDMEYLHDFARAALQGTRDESRIHLINVSRKSVADPNLLEYLEQQGLTMELIASGRAVLVDAGYTGTLFKMIEQRLPPSARGRLRLKLLTSLPPSHPSTRVFLQSVNPLAAEMNPAIMQATLAPYQQLARFQGRSYGFVRRGHVWEPMPSGEDDGVVDPDRSAALMSDMRRAGEHPQARRRLAELRRLWRGLLEAKTKEQLRRRLGEHLLRDSVLGPARVRDLLEHLALAGGAFELKPAELGLGEPLSEPSLVVSPAPARDYQRLADAIDVAAPERLGPIVQALALKPDPRAASLIHSLLKYKSADRLVLEHALSQPIWSDRPEWLESILAKGDQDEALADVLLRGSWEPAWAAWWRKALRLKGAERADFLKRDRPYPNKPL